jgi:Ca2+-binding RTX toxin-like protein
MTRSKHPFALVALAALLLVSVVPGAPSFAGGSPNTCEFDEADHRVTVTIYSNWGALNRDGESITFRKGHFAQFRDCDGATVHNTDLVVMLDESEEGHGALYVELSNGHFAPGRTLEKKGISEIEFRFDAAGEANRLYGRFDFGVTGTRFSDTIVGGTKGMTFNDDSDLDARPVGKVNGYSVRGHAGDDSIFLDGRDGTGAFDPELYRWGHVISGGRGADLLVGGPDGDWLFGDEGADRMFGRAGEEGIYGGPGPDKAVAGSERDFLYGEEDNDHLEGSSGNDFITGDEGNDHLDGDAGQDECKPGPGKDTQEDCED